MVKNLGNLRGKPPRRKIREKGGFSSFLTKKDKVGEARIGSYDYTKVTGKKGEIQGGGTAVREKGLKTEGARETT